MQKNLFHNFREMNWLSFASGTEIFERRITLLREQLESYFQLYEICRPSTVETGFFLHPICTKNCQKTIVNKTQCQKYSVSTVL